MKPRYAATAGDLGPHDKLHVWCQCKREEDLTAEMLGYAGVAPETKIDALEPRLKCRQCGQRGQVLITILWADAPKRPG